MEYKKGLRVKHPTMPAWGVGEVLEDSSGGKVKVFFVGGGEKTLSVTSFDLLLVDGEEAKHPILDNLKLTVDGELTYRSLPESIARFSDEFPGGFYGEKFADHERNYKVDAHGLMKELLSQNEFKRLLENGDYDDICRRAVKVVNSTNLVFPNEKMSLKDGLKSGDDKQRFSQSLYEQLFGESELEKRFMNFCDVLYEIKAGKWTIASYFLFFAFPENHMFIKPTITQNAADICAFDIHYKPELNWATYDTVLRFSQFLKEELEKADLKPRDMIDVQSFMWCIRPDKTIKSFGKKKENTFDADDSAN